MKFVSSLIVALLLAAVPAFAGEKLVYVGTANISILPIVAAEKGFFAEEGLEVEMQLVQTGKLCMEALLAERADFGTLVATNFAYAGFQTDHLRLLASYGLSLDDAVVMPSSSPIHTVADLKGRRIGLAPSTSSQAFLSSLLEKNGMAYSDVTIVALQPPTLLPALTGGQVDAVVTWQPWRYAIAAGLEGGTREINNTADIYPRRNFLASTAERLEQHKASVPALLRALLKAEAFVNAHPDETAQIFAQKVGQAPEAVKTYMISHHMEINDSILPLITYSGQWAIDHQADFAGKTLPDYSVNLAPDYLLAVAPDRVTLEEKQ